MTRLQLILAGVFGAGVLLTGIGTGVALKEYSSLQYSGEHIIEAKNMQTQKGEIEFLELKEGEKYQIFCGSDEYEIVEDASVPEMVVQYEALYNADRVGVIVHGIREENYFSIGPHWKGESEFEVMMSCKDEILKELKQNRIGNYRTVEIQKIKLSVNPKTAEMLYVE